MNTANEIRKTRKPLYWLRPACNFALYEAFANHTPSGPMALSTGQAGAAGRRGRYIRQTSGARGPERPSQTGFSIPPQRVFRT